jgi:hypothetical protein
MGFSRQIALLCLPVFMMACVPVPSVPAPEPLTPEPPAIVAPPAEDRADACGATAMQDLVGNPFSALAAMTFAGPMRLIRPDMAVTMDFNPERLNIYLDEADLISSVTCG